MPMHGYEFYLRVFNSIVKIEHEKLKFIHKRECNIVFIT